MKTRALTLIGRLLPLLFAGVATLVAAFEPAAVARYASPAGSDAGGNACVDPAAPCATLAHALGRALPGDTIHLAAGTYRESGLVVVQDVTIAGSGAGTTALEGAGDATLLTVTGSGALTLEDVALRGGGGWRGGAVLVEAGGQLTARRVALSGNTADWGGGLYLAGGAAVIEDSRLAQNTAGGGGGIFAAAGTLTLVRSRLDDNAADVGGGVLVGPAAAVTLSRATLEGNAARHGGGAYVQGALHAVNSLWRANRATGRGGGLFNDDGQTLLEHTGWMGNTAVLGGGLAGVGTARLRNSLMAGNGGGNCATTLAGSDNLIDDATCGLPARPATGLTAEGRPGGESNAIDAVPADRCTSAADGQPPAEDWRGEPRPADGDGDGAARCDIGPYEFQPRLVITLAPSLDDASRFDFSGALGPFALSAARPRRAFEVAPGSYRLAQARKASWKTAAITCGGDTDGGSVVELKARAVTLDLDAGETLRCTYSAQATRNTVGVAFVAADGPAVLPVSGDLGSFELRAPDAADRRSGKLAPGPYAVAASPPAGWRIDAIQCAGDRDGGSTVNTATGAALIDLDKNETIGCVYYLTRVTPSATLTIRHEAAPAEDVAFTYTGDLGPFLLRAPSAAAASYDLRPGVYWVHELLHPLWLLSDVACQGDADGGTVIDREDATIAVDVDMGEQITCVFRHVRAAADAGSITLVQTATPAEAVAFAYDGALGAFALALPDGGTRTWAALPPGNYNLRQTPPAGWQLDAITCQGDSDGGSVLTPEERAATLDLDAGEALVCTFANSRPASGGSIAISHAPDPADDTDFRYLGALGGFTLRAPSRPTRVFSGLAAGAYAVNVRLPDGWQTSHIVCEGDSDGGSVVDVTTAGAVIDLDQGEAIACRFAFARSGAPPPPAEPRRVYIPYLGR